MVFQLIFELIKNVHLVWCNTRYTLTLITYYIRDYLIARLYPTFLTDFYKGVKKCIW